MIELRQRAKAEQAKRERVAAERAELRRETDRVLGEWDADRRREAEAVARERLGWDEAAE